MKQTFVGKIKRFALTLFAALCVGSVWAGYLTFEAQNFAVSEDGMITFNAKLGYHGTETDRYAQLTAVGYNANGEVAFQETKVIGEELTELKLEEEGEGDGFVTHLCTIPNSGLSATENYKIVFHFWAVKADGSLSSDYDITQYLTPPMGVLGVRAQYNYKPIQGISFWGKYDTTAGIDAIKINYSVNSTTLGENIATILNPGDGTFGCTIPLDNLNNTVTYQLVASYNDGTEKMYVDDVTASTEITVAPRRTTELQKTVYTWTGKGDGVSWKDVRNWAADHPRESVGYPGAWNGDWYWTRVRFTNSVDRIDMHGETYGFVDDGAFELDKNISVTLYNARLLITYNHFWNNSEALGSNPGPTLTLDKIGISYINEPRTEYGTFELNIPAGYKVVLNNPQTSVEKSTSTTKGYFKYNPAYSTGNSLTVQNGELYTSYGSADFYGAEEVIISNAIWHVKHDSDKVLATQKMRFFDGPDRQARLIAAEGSGYKKMKLGGTYYIKIPATPYSTSYVLASLLHSSDTCTMNIDVSNYNKNAELVPLIQFKGTLDNNTKNAMTTMTTDASKLVVTADGVDVKHRRRAELVWDEAAKTLYYSQDPIKGFRVIVR